jgi:hypothetical protein
MKKVYRFDYIEEWVSKWSEDIPRTKETIASVPFDIRLPFINYEDGKLVIYPAKDHYGEEIDDINDWLEQRNKYCENLAIILGGK